MAEPELTPYTPGLGVCIDGLAPGALQQADTIEWIRRTLDQYQVVVIRDQHLDPHKLRDFVSAFGPLFIHPDDDAVLPAGGLAEVLEMRKAPDGDRLFGGSDWHADVTFRNPAGYMSALYAVTLPPVGGDTLFSSTLLAYEHLDRGIRETLEPLQAVHSYSGPGQPDHPTETAIHPVVRRHPASGRAGIYCNRMFVTRFVDMSAEDSRPLIDLLDRHCSRPEFSFRLRWQPGDLALWDNRFTLHYPVNDFSGHARLLIRCTAMESAPSG